MSEWKNPYGVRAQLNILKCLKRKYAISWVFFWNGGFLLAFFSGRNPDAGKASFVTLLICFLVLFSSSSLAFRVASVRVFQDKVLDEKQRDKFQPETFSFLGFICALLAICCTVAMLYDLSTKAL